MATMNPLIKDTSAYSKILRARTSLVINHPFFASLALRLKVREDYSCETAWTDGKVFGYNPLYVRALSPDKLEGLTAHTVMHPACGHHTRRQNRDHDLWNRACDYAVNGILLESGFTLPDGFLLNDAYEGKSAEAVYTILERGLDDSEQTEEESDPEAGDNSAASGDDTSELEASALPGGQEESEEESQEASPSGDPGKSGEVRDTPAGGETDPDLETDWNEALTQAFVNARGMGKLPAGVERFIHRRINPKLNWRELLARFIEQSARSDYSWVSPNRRYIHQELYLPSLQNQELSTIVVAVDTSGSIEPAELAQFSAEVSDIMERYPATLHVIYCDAKISGYDVFSRCDLPVALRPKGGGGTDFRPVFDLVAKNGLMPSCLIYLTDLECLSYPDQPPPYPVLWVKTGNSDNRAPFGDVIQL